MKIVEKRRSGKRILLAGGPVRLYYNLLFFWFRDGTEMLIVPDALFGKNNYEYEGTSDNISFDCRPAG